MNKNELKKKLSKIGGIVSPEIDDGILNSKEGGVFIWSLTNEEPFLKEWFGKDLPDGLFLQFRFEYGDDGEVWSIGERLSDINEIERLVYTDWEWINYDSAIERIIGKS